MRYIAGAVCAMLQAPYALCCRRRMRYVAGAAYANRYNTEKILHFVHFRKRRLLKPPRIKSKTGCPEVDLLTEFHCNKNKHSKISNDLFTKDSTGSVFSLPIASP